MAFEYERQREKDVIKKKQETQERMDILEKAREEREVSGDFGSVNCGDCYQGFNDINMNSDRFAFLHATALGQGKS